ncbi:MAG: hypothetical protein ACKOPN_11365 [Prochlorococcaceae cyanobacterium]
MLQELVGENGERYALLAAVDDPALTINVEPTTLNGLASVPLPKGCTYESSLLMAMSIWGY